MELLLEIITEEMPPSHVKAALVQLEELLAGELKANRLVDKQNRFGKLRTFGTCRRLVVWADLVSRQRDKEERIIGPPKAVAFAADGSPGPAALGFAKSQGIAVADLRVVRTEKGEYVAGDKKEAGRPSSEVLPLILPRILSSLSFPKMMRWGEGSFRFSRPIKNILCLGDGKRLPFSVDRVHSVAFTRGHKFLSPKKLMVKSFREYRAALKENHVFIDQEERRRKILAQICRRLRALEAELYPDPDLLEKLTFEVECPYVFLGNFPREYLALPVEVLSTAMREGQHLFSLMKGKKQIPFFLGVADALKDPRSLIKKGNERVLKARLEDAKFFWEQDLEKGLNERAAVLDRVVFQEGLGSYWDKTERLKKTVAYLADKVETPASRKAAVEAAALCKADLVTEMVREFPSLQGIMGGLYARKQGYPLQVWKAIYEHYLPVSLDDPVPSQAAGALLSVVDKLDSIVGSVGMGVEPSGSRDPYGLRRNAHGVCKVILARKWSFSFARLLDKVIREFGDKLERDREETKAVCLDFFAARLQYMFEREDFRYDLIQASLAPGVENLYHAYLRLKALDALKDSAHFESLILIAKRVNNILRGHPVYRINEGILVEKQERELFTSYSIIQENVHRLVAEGDYVQAQKMLYRLQSTINHFFDQVLVMTDDTRIRKNRLALLQGVSRLFGQIADYSRVVVER